jgi:maleamate amidohydrolase
MSDTWDRFLTPRDQEVRGAYGSKLAGFGKRPAVMVIDINYNFTGDRREPILESIKRWRNSCGAEGWDAAERTGELLRAARAKRLPVIHTTEVDQRSDGWDSGRWADKNARRREDRQYDREHAIGENGDRLPGMLPRTNKQIHAGLEPQVGDIFVGKSKPSAFFGTMLISFLVNLQCDTLLVCGSTTSGCVRATVVDGFSYNYRMMIVQECTFDRFEASHAMNLFDMHMKYADVVSLSDVLDYLDELPSGLFDSEMPSLRDGAVVEAS